ncbi:uncharacterized protein LOC129768083 isoform X2 [Toxorhynchites rutilus septentrionalis]|uniref:uncharacterized protein LOC129768083 isoform X2 n=1 Tax=Toxorhynchites rutilus septentrionalis TaxID=329112 RepID=UPI0024786218|nr:uncharacterized protein LOC129768083 isoform X2 [Toxorhynchites rutilus septentrionalis]
MYSYYYLVVMLFHLSWMISAETEDDFQTSTLPPADSYPYCFRFTWLGPKYNKDSPFKNVTCENLLKKATGIPCFHPLVVTNNSNVPDTEYMWNEYKDKPTQIGCRLVRGEVCARFTYRYNGARASSSRATEGGFHHISFHLGIFYRDTHHQMNKHHLSIIITRLWTLVE